MQYQGIDEQLVVNRGLPPIAKEVGLPLVCTNDVHYLRQDDHRPHDVLLCIGTGKNVQDEQRLRYHGDQFYLKTPEEMAGYSATSRSAAEHGGHSRALRRRLSAKENHLPGFDVPEGFTVDGYFEHVVRQGFEERLTGCAIWSSAGRCGIPSRRMRRSSPTR